MTMAQLWGGRFTKQTDQLVFDFNASITVPWSFSHLFTLVVYQIKFLTDIDCN